VFFRTLYLILLGEPQGPRFGPYVEAIGKEGVIEELERALRES
jgi:lysyl-tRNA synthetase class I